MMSVNEEKRNKMEENDGGVSSVFSFLPEDCISSIIAFTSPKDACRGAAVSCGFKSASESDFTWERFLPPDYKEIISKSVNPPGKYATKKELFFNLCHFPILVNGGKLSFWLSKSSGKKCYMLCSRELSIARKDNPTYWGWPSIPESRFSEVAELRSVCWLDIQTKMQAQMLSSKTTYVVYLVYTVAEVSYDLQAVARVSVTSTDATSSGNTTSTCCINVVDPAPSSNYRLPQMRTGWHRRVFIELAPPQPIEDGSTVQTGWMDGNSFGGVFQ